MLLLYIIIYSPKLLYMYVVYRTHDQYLSHQDPRKAIHFYTKAQCYTPALQLAKELELNNDLMRLALLSSHEDMIDAARSVLCRCCVCTCTALKTAVWLTLCNHNYVHVLVRLGIMSVTPIHWTKPSCCIIRYANTPSVSHYFKSFVYYL